MKNLTTVLGALACVFCLALAPSPAMADVDCDNEPTEPAAPDLEFPVGPGPDATPEELQAYIDALAAYSAALDQFLTEYADWEQEWLTWHYECMDTGDCIVSGVTSCLPWGMLTSYDYPTDEEMAAMCQGCDGETGQAKIDCLRDAVSDFLPDEEDCDCSDHSAVLGYVLDDCGYDYSLQISSPTDDPGHAWVWVQDASGCYLVDSVNGITVSVECPPEPEPPDPDPMPVGPYDPGYGGWSPFL